VRKQTCYGDEGTIVTLREQAVAVIFVIGVAALLVCPLATPYDEPPGTIAQTAAAVQVESSAAPAGVPDVSRRSTHRAQSEAP
jgi:hypothetical protein